VTDGSAERVLLESVTLSLNRQAAAGAKMGCDCRRRRCKPMPQTAASKEHNHTTHGIGGSKQGDVGGGVGGGLGQGGVLGDQAGQGGGGGAELEGVGDGGKHGGGQQHGVDDVDGHVAHNNVGLLNGGRVLRLGGRGVVGKRGYERKSRGGERETSWGSRGNHQRRNQPLLSPTAPTPSNSPSPARP